MALLRKQTHNHGHPILGDSQHWSRLAEGLNEACVTQALPWHMCNPAAGTRTGHTPCMARVCTQLRNAVLPHQRGVHTDTHITKGRIVLCAWRTQHDAPLSEGYGHRRAATPSNARPYQRDAWARRCKELRGCLTWRSWKSTLASFGASWQLCSVTIAFTFTHTSHKASLGASDLGAAQGSARTCACALMRLSVHTRMRMPALAGTACARAS